MAIAYVWTTDNEGNATALEVGNNFGDGGASYTWNYTGEIYDSGIQWDF